ncbi:hypothetical protein PINS_up014092 [Pythium insidiosum]|nr:hypothetical protein PINS_up014092 [Pythium insidiosum]
MRTAVLTWLTFVFAVYCSLDSSNSHDSYLMSNAMFSLETEELLKAMAATSSHKIAMLNVHETEAKSAVLANATHAVNATERHAVNATELHASNETTAASSKSPSAKIAATTAAVEWTPLMRYILSQNEVASYPSGMQDKYPFWRKTLRYDGEKRFSLRKTETPPNILLFNIESLRAKEVGVLGGRAKKAQYNQTVTPFLDTLSRSGVLFRQHYSPCTQTSRSLMTTLFGVMPMLSKDNAVKMFPRTKLRLRSLPQLLTAHRDYRNVFWSAVDITWDGWNSFLTHHGFNELFDQHAVLKLLSPESRARIKPSDTFGWGRHDWISLEALEGFLEQEQQASSKRPLFMDIYTISTHDPWKLPDGFSPSTNYSAFLTEHNEKFVHSVNYVDQQLERFFARARRKGLLNNTIVLIEGDHGNGFMEHNNPSVVASEVFEEMSHIPFLLVADDLLDAADRGRVVDDTTSQMDLLATVADMLDIRNFTQHSMGQSLMRRPAAGDPELRPALLENPFAGTTKGLKFGDLKLSRRGSGRFDVYNLTIDPDERAPVESGQLNGDTGKPLGSVSPVTAAALQFVDRAIGLAQFMYDSNGFMPPDTAA